MKNETTPAKALALAVRAYQKAEDAHAAAHCAYMIRTLDEIFQGGRSAERNEILRAAYQQAVLDLAAAKAAAQAAHSAQ